MQPTQSVSHTNGSLPAALFSLPVPDPTATGNTTVMDEILCQLQSGIADRVLAGCLLLGGMSPMEQEPYVEACLTREGAYN